jgi:hypothetical protein
VPAGTQAADALPECKPVIRVTELHLVQDGRRLISGAPFVDLVTRAGHLCVMMLQIAEEALRAP